jgi:hypothetical protein
MDRRTPDDFRAEINARHHDQQHGDGLTQHNPSDSDIIREAQEAAHRLVAGQSWEDWKAVARALQVVRTQSMAEANTNKPEGKHYAAAISRRLADAKLDKLLGGNEHKALRCRLLDLIDRISDVETWRAKLPTNKRLKWNHPLTVYKNWQNSIIPTNNNSEKPGSPVAKLKQSVAELSEENQRLKQLNGGNTFTAKDTARDVVRILRSMFSESKLTEIRKLLGQAEKTPTKPHFAIKTARSLSSLFDGYRKDSEQQLAERIAAIQRAATHHHLSDADWRAVDRMRSRLAELKHAQSSPAGN